MVERKKEIETTDAEGNKVFREVAVNPWGFLVAMPTKVKLLKIISRVAPDLVSMLDGSTITETDDIDVGMIIKVIASAVESFDEKELAWFMKIILTYVHVDGADMGEEVNQDNYFQCNTTFFYQIVRHSLEVNYGDFFEMLQTRMESVAN